MNEETRAYLEYLLNFNELKKPPMPKFNLLAYNDNEYKYAVLEFMEDYDKIDDMYLTLEYLQGEQWK